MANTTIDCQKITTLVFDVDDTLYDVGNGFTAHRNSEVSASSKSNLNALIVDADLFFLQGSFQYLLTNSHVSVFIGGNRIHDSQTKLS
jgi:FMN phosphatase YigB (HAD superfamily)